MRRNAGFWESLVARVRAQTSRVEIVSEGDLRAKRLKPLAKRIAETIAERHPDLVIFGVSRTDDPWNYDHPLLWGMNRGYVIHVSGAYDLRAVKRTCMPLELDESGTRIADIDVYASRREKIGRADLDA